MSILSDKYNKDRMEPAFIIVGAQKGGTTSLYDYLVRHSRILPAKEKEVNFFDQKFSKGIDWYLSHFPFRLEGSITGEATPNYCIDPRAIRRMAEYFPKAKIIFLLRNPVDRAISHYRHNLRHNSKRWTRKRENLTFENAVRREKGRMESDFSKILLNENHISKYYRHYSYLTRGKYIEQIGYINNFFSRDQVLILKSEDMFSETAKAVQAVLDFLGVQNFILSEYNTSNKNRIQPDSIQISEDFRFELNQYFKPYNEKLYELLGVRYDWS